MQIRNKRNLTALVLLTAVALLTGVASAAMEEKIMLKADKAGKGAKGEAMIKEMGDQREIAITMTGLKPNAVYTVWLVNMKPKMDMMGMGMGDYSFKSDDKGNGSYTATVSAMELAKWQMLEIAYQTQRT